MTAHIGSDHVCTLGSEPSGARQGTEISFDLEGLEAAVATRVLVNDSEEVHQGEARWSSLTLMVNFMAKGQE